jgi:hypothetical protein
MQSMQQSLFNTKQPIQLLEDSEIEIPTAESEDEYLSSSQLGIGDHIPHQSRPGTKDDSLVYKPPEQRVFVDVFFAFWFWFTFTVMMLVGVYFLLSTTVSA